MYQAQMLLAFSTTTDFKKLERRGNRECNTKIKWEKMKCLGHAALRRISFLTLTQTTFKLFYNPC